MLKYYISHNDYFGFCVIERNEGNDKIVFTGSIEDCNAKCWELNEQAERNGDVFIPSNLERRGMNLEMEREEILAGIINDFRIGLDETNSVKLETGKVLLPDVHNERELAVYYLNEINPFINDEAGLSCELWGPRIADRIGGSFTEQGYVLDPANLEKEKSEPELNVSENDFEMER